MLNNPPGTLPSAASQSPEQDTFAHAETDYLGSKDHRWMLPFDIGVLSSTGSNSVSITPGLAQGQSMTINVDQVPDRWVVSISAETQASARISLSGAAGGPGYRIGPGGKLKIPANGQSYITITNVSGSALILFGTVVAVGGWQFGDIDVG